ncbi:MAG: threonine--tRNA ligase [Candidatus Woesearchaeota archaeon]
MRISFEGKSYVTEAKTILEFLKEIKKDKDALVAEVNGELCDLTSPVVDNSNLRIYTFADKKGKEVFWHTSSHILAQAVKRLFPNAKLAIGPSIEEGFFYDIDLELREEDLEKIEKEMKKIISEKLPIQRKEISYEEAKKLFQDNPYKLELIEEYKENLTIYIQGEFFDLCKGPHLPNTSYVGAIRITKLAGAYWRGDPNNKMLTRIYGISFPTEKELQDYLTFLEEAKKRDHRILGQKLDLFSFHDEGPGFVFWHYKGMILRNILLDLWRKIHYSQGYQEISTPILLNESLWHTSGHWDHYKKNMYFTTIDDQIYAIKPMNCPGGILVYKSRPRSYKEFPLKLAEIGLVHRHELSGVLHGLLRVRAFTQDDAHIFCEPEYLKKEIKEVVKLIDSVYKIFGFDYHVEISTRPESRVGSDELWDLAENSLEEVCREMNLNYKINPGEGAFYGPKIDFHIRDSLKRTWQCATVQVDFNMPQRFELTYMGRDGTYNHRPVMLHRVVYGSLERFIGILIEHYAGNFPLWLNPVQIKILTVADRFQEKARSIGEKIAKEGFRVEYDFEAMTINKKVRNAELEKVNYILVIGEKDSEERLAVRSRDDKIEFLSLREFLEKLKQEMNEPFKHLF